MLALIKSSNHKMIMNVLLLALIVAAWLVSDFAAEKFNELQVRQVPKPPIVSKPVDVKNLYPVLVEFKKKLDEKAITDDAGIESIFHNPIVVVKEVVAPPIDYAAIIRSNIYLNGTSAGGAFINNIYYKLGDIIWPAVIVDGIVKIHPKLSKVSSKEIVVSYGKGKLTFKMAQ